jgi:hypothetical protein
MDMDLEYFEVKVTAGKKEADELYSMLSNMNLDHMDMPPIPLEAMRDYMEDKKSVLWEVTINDKTYLTFEAAREAVAALMKMVKGAGEDKFPVPPLPAKNLRAYVNGQRENVALMELRRNKDVQVRVKPTEEAMAKKTEKKSTSGASSKRLDPKEDN